MKKMFMVAVLAAASFCAKAQPYITVNNNTSNPYKFTIQADDATMTCNGPTMVSDNIIVAAGSIYSGGPADINDPVWNYHGSAMPATSFWAVSVEDACSAALVSDGTACRPIGSHGSFVDCSSNTVLITWTSSPTGDVTIDIN